MDTYIVKGSLGYAGTDFCEILGEFENEDRAGREAYDVACQQAESMGIVFEEDYSDEDIENDVHMDDAHCGMILNSRDELDFYVEVYKPEKHDKYI